MNSHDIPRHSEPLSPEERVLRERLARLGPHAEPSPALDARILAAAHAAADTPAQRPRAPRRWPMALGIAASLTLAVGIAWQLRPVQEATVYDEAAGATAAQAETAPAPQESDAGVAAADQAGAVAVEASPAAGTSPTQAPDAGARRESRQAVSAPRSAAPRADAPAVGPPAPPEPEVVFDDAAPADAAAADAAMPAPAAPPAVQAVRVPSPEPAAKAISGETRTRALERNSAAAAESATGTAARTAAQSREDALAEDVPPATADSPEVREAWLQRIRELAQAGDTEDARASLREFVHRYPNHPLPDDLRALLQ